MRPRQDKKSENKKVNPEEADTQPMPDSEVVPFATPQMESPFVESQWRLEGLTRAKSTCNLESRLQAVADEDVQDEEQENENPEEEPMTDDDMVVPIVIDYQDNETVQILSDDECVMSPQKPKAPLDVDQPAEDPGHDQKTAGQVAENASSVPAPVVPTSETKASGSVMETLVVPPCKVEIEMCQEPKAATTDQSAKTEVPAEATKVEDVKEELEIREEEEEKINSDEDTTKDLAKKAAKKEITKGTFKAE